MALLVNGANKEAKDKEGQTPLHHVVRTDLREGFQLTPHDAPTIVKVLLFSGANAKVRDKDGRTPFDLAKDNYKLKDTDAYWLLYDAQHQ